MGREAIASLPAMSMAALDRGQSPYIFRKLRGGNSSAGVGRWGLLSQGSGWRRFAATRWKSCPRGFLALAWWKEAGKTPPGGGCFLPLSPSPVPSRAAIVGNPWPPMAVFCPFLPVSFPSLAR